MKPTELAANGGILDVPRSLSGAMARLLAKMGHRSDIPFRVVFADGTDYRNGDAPPSFTILFRTQRAERRLLQFGHVGMLEAYFRGDVDVEGDFALALRAAFDVGLDGDTNPLVAVRNGWHERRLSNRSIAQAKANARFHYGLGEAFFREWLDGVGMLYTCAYWSEGTTTLEAAQVNKMDHVCRKIQLKAGETFVDIGCGWGGLLFHAWERYGALGTGINTTTEQVIELRRELDRRGLADRIGLVECDFREIPGQYDKLLSIGTLEHAGRDQLPQVIRAHAAALKPGGLGVIHFIGHVGDYDTEFYIRKYIFPGGWIPSLARAIEEMERCGLEVLDVENLRRHYALTLDVWAHALRQPLGRDSRARPGALRRSVPPQVANLSLVVRRNVPLEKQLHALVPGHRLQGQRRARLSDEPRLPVLAPGVNAYEQKKARLLADLRAAHNDNTVGLAKNTSNLFRDRVARKAPRVDLSHFNAVLGVDEAAGVVEAEGMTTYVDLVDATLAHGRMPAVVPQLKSITLGGAVAGVGIEATSFRQGLVHDTVVEIEVLTGDHRIVVCTADNEHSDLFHGFPNAYGTLGYALKVKARTMPVKRYVRVDHLRFDDPGACFAEVARHCTATDADFLDGVVFSPNELYLSVGRFTDEAPYASDYTYQRIYYRSLRERRTDFLTARDYIWRWDTDWFWCSKNVGAQIPLLRRILGRKRLNSITYQKIMRWNSQAGVGAFWNRLRGVHAESVIQDVDIPIERAAEFLAFFHNEVGILPVWICPIRAPRPGGGATLYPLPPGTVSINFGFWDVVTTPKPREPGYCNRKIEHKVRELGGIKSLYSDSYFTQDEFWTIYDRPGVSRAEEEVRSRSAAAGSVREVRASALNTKARTSSGPFTDSTPYVISVRRRAAGQRGRKSTRGESR